MVVCYQKIRMIDDEDEGFVTENEFKVTVKTPQDLISRMQLFVMAHPDAEFEEYGEELCLVSWKGKIAEYMDIRSERKGESE